MPIRLQVDTETGCAEEQLTEADLSHGSRSQVAQTATISVTAWVFLMSLVFVGCVLRVAAVFQHSPLELQVSDPARWWHDATHLFTIEPILAIDAFGYQLWLGAVIWLTGGGNVAMVIHNAALSILTPWIWYRVVRELTEQDDIAFAAWAIFSWLPSWIAIYSYTMSETLFLPLFGAGLWLSLKAQRAQSRSGYFASALVWAIAAATRVFALPFAAVMLLWNLWRSPRWVTRVCFATLAFAIIAVPLSVRAHHMLRVWNPFGLPRMNQIYMESGKRTLRFDISRDGESYKWMYEFGSPALYQEPLYPLSHWKSSRQGVTDFSINEDRGITDWDIALRQYQSSWGERLQLWAENSVIFNFAPSWPDNNPERFWDQASILFRWAWLPLAILATGLNFGYFARLTQTERLFAVVSSLAWTLTPLLPAVMEGRYRKPVEGLLIVNLMILVKVISASRELKKASRSRDLDFSRARHQSIAQMPALATYTAQADDRC